MKTAEMTFKVLSAELVEEIRAIMGRYPKPRSAILGALHRVQETLGWLPAEAQTEVAAIFDVSPAEVESLVTFYYMYHRRPVGRYVLKVCRSISCYLRGSDDLRCHLQRQLGIQRGQTTPDGQFTLLEGECLAGCVHAPILQVNDHFVETCTPEKADALLDELRSGKSQFPPMPEPWKP
ncbi:MAG: NADH-quinone oxidoreductase subunit NuoE [Candidatus Eremiobacterota bacterium]